MASCPECGADRGHLLGCSVGDAAFGVRAPTTLAKPENPGDFDDAFELRIRQLALPVMLAAVTLLHLVGPFAFVMKVFAAMWFHEVGHAIAAWFTGHLAFPLPWVTWVGGRGVMPTAVLAAGLFAGARFAWLRERKATAALCAAGGVLALLGRLVPEKSAQTLINFAGDGFGIALGAVAMLAIFARPGSRLHHGALRWGLLALGTAAYVDLSSTWFAAWRDPAEIPFGEQSIAGPSDASRLVDSAGWGEDQLIHRLLAVTLVSGVGLLAAWAWANFRARDDG